MIEFRVRGVLPRDREEMIAKLDDRIAKEMPGLLAYVG